ncbi:HNH endonuclease (plasmid) [Acinetobacter baumannii]
MMNNCALCNIPIIETNQTEEHVIPQAIGGRLKIKNFICRPCNSKFGHSWDCVLADQLAFFSTSLNIKREKKLPNYLVKTLEGKEYLKQPNGDFLLVRPTDEIEKNLDGSLNIKIEAPNLKIAKDILKKVSKNNNLSNESQIYMLENLKHSITPMNQIIQGEINFGGEEAGRSLVKTALAMAFYMGIDLKQCDLATGYLLQNQEPCFGYFYSRNKDFIQNRSNDIPFHCVHIKANSELKRVFGYIEYFGAFRVVLSLASNYEGETKEKSYFIDPINNQEIDLKVELETSDSEIKQIYNYEIYDLKVYEEAIGRLLDKVVRKSKENNVINRINEAVEKWDKSRNYNQNMSEALAYLKPFLDNL